MVIFRQNRYVALLISAILVCAGSVFLLWGKDIQVAAPAGEDQIPSVQRDTSISLPVPIPLLRQMTTLEIKEKPKQYIKKQPEAKEILHPPKQIYFTRTQQLSHDQRDQATWTYEISTEELLLLQKIVMAEAEGEPYEGKVAVANVVLNRLRSANFPDTIYDVIYQKSQFSPVQNGRLDKVKPDQDSIDAVTSALRGHQEVTDDTYYFLSLKLATDLTIARTKEETKVIGDHTFYK